VNKTETRVELLWEPSASSCLNDRQKEQVIRRLGKRLTSDGILVLASERSRSQHTNREEVTDRFIELVTGCLRPQKKRIPTKPSRASREKRLKSKKNRGEIKRLRGRPPDINH